MKPKQRQQLIQELIIARGEASVDELAEHFGVSAETIRRDLGVLNTLGVIKKIHGGAARVRLHSEKSFHERMSERTAEKHVIAEKVAQLIEPNETVFLDTGSSTLICAEVLGAIEGLTVVTNSVMIAQTSGASSKGAKAFLLGGCFAADNSETVGPLVIEQIQRFQADTAVITVAAFDAEIGAMDSDFDEAQVARAMISRARRTIVLADSSKLGRIAAFNVAKTEDIDVLVSGSDVGTGFAAAIKTKGIEFR